ncbi:hypothetical protein GAS19_22365 [Burkholderia glumae]|nr:hypothetical protein GAS19_22365 [Burkholderia glumae]UVS92589.1 hypothetical protein EFP17_22980 [Burkholderia glumae]UVT03138.1 hypothetical protein EFP20_16885 [Burkholderia glumae]
MPGCVERGAGPVRTGAAARRSVAFVRPNPLAVRQPAR